MKRYNIYVLLLIIICMLSLSGCIEGHMHVKFNLDGSADTEFLLLSSPTIGLFGGDEDVFADMKKDLINDDFALQDHKRDGLTGFIANRRSDDIEDFANMTFLKGVDDPEITIEEGFLFNTYHFRHNFELEFPGFEGQGQSLARILDPDFNFMITFPISPISHNAPVVSEDGKTMQWKLSFEERNDIEVVVNVPNVQRILLLVLAIMVLITGGIIMVLRVKAKKNNRSSRAR